MGLIVMEERRERVYAPQEERRDRDLRPAYRFSTALAAAAALAGGVTGFAPQILRDAPMTTGNAQGTALVILLVAVPLMLAGMVATRRGLLVAPLVWLGAAGYILYNSIFFAYAARFNGLFLLYAAQLPLAFWSVVMLVWGLDLRRLAVHAPPRRVTRVVACYLLLTTVLFALMWLRDIIPAAWHNVAPASLDRTGMVTNAIEMTDLAFFFPLTILSAVWLLRRRALGYLGAGAFLLYGVIESVSIAVDQTFGHMHDASASTAAVPLFVVLAVIGLVPLAAYLRGFKPRH